MMRREAGSMHTQVTSARASTGRCPSPGPPLTGGPSNHWSNTTCVPRARSVTLHRAVRRPGGLVVSRKRRVPYARHNHARALVVHPFEPIGPANRVAALSLEIAQRTEQRQPPPGACLIRLQRDVEGEPRRRCLIGHAQRWRLLRRQIRKLGNAEAAGNFGRGQRPLHGSARLRVREGERGGRAGPYGGVVGRARDGRAQLDRPVLGVESSRDQSHSQQVPKHSGGVVLEPLDAP
eukprot:scaffold26646_cov142-Isochrysis_galbana.AAC.2